MILVQHRSGRAGGAIVLALFLASLLIVFPLLYGMFRRKQSIDPKIQFRFAQVDPSELKIRDWHHVPELGESIAQFETVFWEPDDTATFREWLRDTSVDGKDVLEVGTGTGLVALVCNQFGAKQVVATDINPNAYANALYNADHLGVADTISFRLVDEDNPGPFSTVAEDEKFDWIVSNPPWEDRPVKEVAAYALYDEGFELLTGLLEQSQSHLNAGGRLLLIYGARTAIQRILDQAPKLGWEVTLRDDRKLEDLPEVFVPAMLLDLKPLSSIPESNASAADNQASQNDSETQQNKL